MSARNTHRGFGTSHVLPTNHTLLDFPRSDGNPSNWPLNTTLRVDDEGHVNYMREVALDEPLSIKWRTEVGATLASRLNMAPGNNYVLRGWPEGYQMFDHNKGPKDNPRHDAYLIGSTYAKRFRSVPEFIPHALWLLTDPALDRSNCSCKYCNKKPQKEITASMGLLPKRGGSTPSSTPTRSAPIPPRLKRQPHPLKERNPTRDREKTAREREKDKPFVGVRRAPKIVKQPAPKQSMLRERNFDLSCAYGSDVTTRRWFREGELLWCALNPPIEGPSGPGGDDSIFFWPGIVEETRNKPIPIPKDTTVDRSDGPSTVYPSDGDEVPWIVHHVLSYKMKLLGVSHSFYFPDDQVLPYQAIVPPDELIQAIHDVPIEELQRDPAHTSAFNPCSISGEKIHFASAAASYGIALQVGANIAGYWAPTDDWEFKFTIEHPNAGIPPPLRPSGSFQSLDSVMNSTMIHNANLSTSLATPSGSEGNTPTISAPLAPSLAPGQTVAQTRYQGLWWGAERIWTDELVRLKFSRAQVAPNGTDFIYAPARPSKRTLEYAEGMGSEAGGSETRGVFMRLEGLYVADSPNRGGSKVCHAVGMLYDLVDEDWEEEDSREGASSEVVIGKGKGKASASVDGTPVMDGVTPGFSFMSAPSPLKPSPLANPDPAVPVGNTTTDVLSHSSIPGAPASSAPKQSANGALSRPVLSSPFPLPEAPDGFKFRPILKPDTELIVDLTWIAGRYYPGLLKHKLLDRHVERAFTSGGVQLWALEGLTPGYYNTMDPTKWRATRSMMVREANREARAGLEKHWEDKEKERQETKLLEGSFLPPLGSDGVEGSGLGQIPGTAGTDGQESNGNTQGMQDGGSEWRAFANGMLEDNAISVD